MSALWNVKSDPVRQRRDIAIILSNLLPKVVYAIPLIKGSHLLSTVTQSLMSMSKEFLKGYLTCAPGKNKGTNSDKRVPILVLEFSGKKISIFSLNNLFWYPNTLTVRSFLIFNIGLACWIATCTPFIWLEEALLLLEVRIPTSPSDPEAAVCSRGRFLFTVLCSFLSF